MCKEKTKLKDDEERKKDENMWKWDAEEKKEGRKSIDKKVRVKRTGRPRKSTEDDGKNIKYSNSKIKRKTRKTNKGKKEGKEKSEV